MPTEGMELVVAAVHRAESSEQIERAIELYTHGIEIFPNGDSLYVELERLKAALCYLLNISHKAGSTGAPGSGR